MGTSPNLGQTGFDVVAKPRAASTGARGTGLTTQVTLDANDNGIAPLALAA